MNGVIFSKGAGVADSVFGKSQEPIRVMIDENVEAFRAQSMIHRLFFMDTSKNYAEKYTSETSLGDFENVGENGAYPKTSMREGYAKVIEPATWKSSFEVTQEMVEDAKIGKIRSRAQHLRHELQPHAREVRRGAARGRHGRDGHGGRQRVRRHVRRRQAAVLERAPVRHGRRAPRSRTCSRARSR